MTDTTSAQSATQLPPLERGVATYTEQRDRLDVIARDFARSEAFNADQDEPNGELYHTALQVLQFAENRTKVFVQPDGIGEGDIVDIMFKGVRVLGVNEPGAILVEVGNLHHLVLPVTDTAISVSRIAPKWWPPLPGDIIRTYHLGSKFATRQDEERGYPYEDAISPADYVARKVHDDDCDMGVRLYPIDGENSADGEDPHGVARRSWRSPELLFRMPQPDTAAADELVVIADYVYASDTWRVEIVTAAGYDVQEVIDVEDRSEASARALARRIANERGLRYIDHPSR